MVSESGIDFAIDVHGDGATVRCLGSWTAANLPGIERRLSTAQWPAGDIRFDLAGIDALDTVGAWVLHSRISALEAEGAGGGRQVQINGADKHKLRLLALVGSKSAGADHPPKPYLPGVLESAGRHASTQVGQYLDFLSFIGNLAVFSFLAILRPWRIRWPQVVKELQAAGVNALPIVGLLTFLIGIVIAYQGGMVLRDYGANLYVADIVAAGEAILRFTDGVTFEAFAANEEKRAAVEREVFIVGEAAARLPEEWKQRQPEVPWRKIVGLRNLLAHGYWVIDAEELWDIARHKVPEFVARLRPLLDESE